MFLQVALPADSALICPASSGLSPHAEIVRSGFCDCGRPRAAPVMFGEPFGPIRNRVMSQSACEMRSTLLAGGGAASGRRSTRLERVLMVVGDRLR
jgi:hypothetical protein